MAAKSKKPAKPESRTITQIVDDLGQADRAIEAVKSQLSPLTEVFNRLRFELFTALALPPDQAGVGEGSLFLVTVSAMANKRTVKDMPKLRKLLGDDVFYANCEFPLGALDKLLPEEARGQVIETSRTGARTVKVIARPKQ